MRLGKVRLWPASLRGQMLLSIALALLVAQGLSAALLWRAQVERREAALLHTAAFRLASAERRAGEPPVFRERRLGRGDGPRWPRIERLASSPQRSGEARMAGAETELRGILTELGVVPNSLVVIRRELAEDPHAIAQMVERGRRFQGRRRGMPDHVVVAAIQRAPGSVWLATRVLVPATDRWLALTLVGQTLLLFVVLMAAVALILRRITRPLAALTARVERFDARDGAAPLTPSGPDDVRRLVLAHNAMTGRIGALLDEKDVMLGAIGHDLKTPLAALRVRIEAVEDDTERAKMAATIEDIVRSLDDILTLARVGRPSDAPEATELSALAAAVVEEYEDLGEPVTLAEGGRLVAPVRATWLRRALRNLIDNALRYGARARVSLAREGTHAVIRVEDDGPGIPPGEIARMLEPFTRMEASRNSMTGGAGLGLTLARAIAEQHGGTLELANHADGAGLVATIRLPL